MSACADLAAAAERLADRLAGVSPAWWAARAASGAESRAETVRALVASLARLGVVAGTGQPADALPPALGDHALADQLIVVVGELVQAGDEAVAVDALAALSAARERLGAA